MAHSAGNPDPRLARFAQWSANLRLADMPAAAVAAVKNDVRDALGCALFGSRLPWSRAMLEAFAADAPGTGPVTVWGTGVKLPGTLAAMVNGACVQAFEMDTMHQLASLHAGATMLPVVLAIAEQRGNVSGATLIAAMAAGWELGTRVAMAGGPALIKGWHTPTINGTFAAAAAGARALQLDAEKTAHCLGLAALQAFGILAVQYGGDAKRLYAGKASESGLQAALLAERGYKAPPDAMECAPGGYFSTFAGSDGSFAAEKLTEGLGTPDMNWAAKGIGFKLYATCAPNLTSVDLMRGFRAQGLRPDDVAAIDVYLGADSFHHVGWPYEPGDATGAQFNLRYTLSVALLEGDAFVEQYRQELLADPRILTLTRQIHIHEDPAITAKGRIARNSARIRVTRSAGSPMEAEAMVVRGAAGNEATDEELQSKFERLARTVLDGGRVQQLGNSLAGLEELASAREICGMLAA